MRDLQVLTLFASPYGPMPFRCCMEFNDPYQMLDWMKEQNLTGRGVTILHWTYGPRKEKSDED